MIRSGASAIEIARCQHPYHHLRQSTLWRARGRGLVAKRA